MRLPGKNGNAGRTRSSEAPQGERSQEAGAVGGRTPTPSLASLGAVMQDSSLPIRQILGSADKLRLKADFDYVRSKGRRVSTPLAVVLAAPSTDGSLKCGVICGRKFHPRAVRRNRARRLLWESFRLLKRSILPCHLLLIPRKEISGAKMQQVKSQLQDAMSRLRLWNTASHSNPSSHPQG